MSRFCLLVLAGLILLTPARAHPGEIPNGGFEEWTDFAPVGYGAFQPPNLMFRTVFRSDDAHTGKASALIRNVGFYGQRINGGIYYCQGDCRSGPGKGAQSMGRLTFPIQPPVDAICGYYKAKLLGGDTLFISLALSAGDDIVAGTDAGTRREAFLTRSADVWTPFMIPITTLPGKEGRKPNGAKLQIALFGRGFPQDPMSLGTIGSEAQVDSLSFCGSGADLRIYPPAVISGTGSPNAVPEPIEASIGAQTFVNLDNDDGDGSFDTNPEDKTTDLDVPKDDELVRVVLRLTPDTLEKGTASLQALSGGENIRIWETASKGAEFDRNTRLEVPAAFERRDGGLEKELWLEGIAPHTDPSGTRLKLTYSEQPDAGDEVKLTILGVKTMRWVGQANGFTRDGRHDSDDLDEDPILRAAMPGLGSNRVFAGARAPEVHRARDQVRLEVELTTPPVEPVSIFLRAFDVDDPEKETDFIDPNDRGGSGTYDGTSITWSAEEDNRGSPPGGGRAGRLEGQNAEGIAALKLEAGEVTKQIAFQVSQQPGDNYRVAASGDPDFLKALRNLDQEDGLRLVDPRVMPGGKADQREVRKADLYTSKVLSVWRLLHVERDSMAKVPDTGPQRNQVEGNIVRILGSRSAGTARQVYLSVNLEKLSPPPDLSLNLRTGGHGRFENGVIEIGPERVRTGNLLGNGPDYVKGNTDIDIPFEILRGRASDVRVPTAAGKVVALDRTKFTLSVTSGVVNRLQEGSILKVAGVPMTIARVEPAEALVHVAALVPIPFVLRDDDDQGLLPRDLDLKGLDAFEAAYVRPVNDGGGNRANDGHDVPFVLNAPRDYADAQLYEAHRGSKDSESRSHWVVYVCAAYQSLTWDDSVKTQKLGDDDPDSEPVILGSTTPHAANDAIVAQVGEGSLIFLEVVRETMKKDPHTSEALTLVHEVGHQFGFAHGQSYPEFPKVGLMHPLGEDGVQFRPRYINRIRSRIESPGRK